MIKEDYIDYRESFLYTMVRLDDSFLLIPLPLLPSGHGVSYILYILIIF